MRNYTNITWLRLLSGYLLTLPMAAQTPAAAPAFEVAVIKPFAAGSASGRYSIDNARVRFGGIVLKQVIEKAYNVKSYEIAGPDWLAITPFDIEATLPEGATVEQVPMMLQALLAERFKMAVHRENRELPVYAIVVDKGGIKFKEKAPGPDPSPSAPPPGATVSDGPNGQTIMSKGQISFTATGGGLRFTMGEKGLHFEVSQVSALADFFSRGAGRLVLDKTNLKGSYQIEFDVSDEEMDDPAAAAAFAPQGAPVASTPVDGSAFFRDILKKIGLNVESQKSQVEMLVIDHIEKTPTEN